MSEFRKYLLALLSAATLFSASGCTKKKPEPTPTPTAETEPAATEKSENPEVTEEPVTTPEATDEPVSTPEPTPEASISEDDIYDTKDEVALYIYTFHHLPSCYMTKKEARKRGWEGGALNRTIKGMCIGGDYFGNYEGLLPETGEDYYECDIDTMYKKSRGSKRIIYTESGDVWYTDDHYESYTQLYDGDE
ncbi:MAG: hypothetical protein IJM63_04925 [Solobacterium sp.]|nr:hypothetical protein [Solobacterium sp.]